MNGIICSVHHPQWAEARPPRGWVQQKPLYAWTAWRLRTSGRMRTSPGNYMCVCSAFDLCRKRPQLLKLSLLLLKDERQEVSSFLHSLCVTWWGCIQSGNKTTVAIEKNRRDVKHTTLCGNGKVVRHPHSFTGKNYFLQRRKCLGLFKDLFTNYCIALSVFDIYLLQVILAFVRCNDTTMVSWGFGSRL